MVVRCKHKVGVGVADRGGESFDGLQMQFCLGVGDIRMVEARLGDRIDAADGVVSASRVPYINYVRVARYTRERADDVDAAHTGDQYGDVLIVGQVLGDQLAFAFFGDENQLVHVVNCIDFGAKVQKNREIRKFFCIFRKKIVTLHAFCR